MEILLEMECQTSMIMKQLKGKLNILRNRYSNYILNIYGQVQLLLFFFNLAYINLSKLIANSFLNSVRFHSFFVFNEVHVKTLLIYSEHLMMTK